jgi:hypothetical protein
VGSSVKNFKVGDLAALFGGFLPKHLWAVRDQRGTILREWTLVTYNGMDKWPA